MTHDPKLVDELLAQVDRYFGNETPDTSRFCYDLIKAREALRPAPPKPREWWLNLYPNHPNVITGVHPSYESAKDKIGHGGETVHVREVMPNDDKPPVKSLFDTQTLLANGYAIVQRKTPGEPFHIRTDVENWDKQYVGMIDDHGKFHPNPSPDLPFANPLTTKAWDTK
jgi:hypothetical protein